MKTRELHPGWEIQRRFGPGSATLLLAMLVLLGGSFYNQKLHEAVADTPSAAERAVEFLERAWPPKAETAQRVERMIQLGGDDEVRATRALEREHTSPLPWSARIESRPLLPDDAASNEEAFYVRPVGYIERCVGLMIATIEMALWGTIVALLISIPVAFLSASNYSFGIVVYTLARGFSSLMRAIPELILALVLALMYGFGPTAGILALGLHTSGFLGKFLADDLENADRGPQDALRSTGADRLKVLRMAALPQVLPQYIAYTQYILERNVRTASVLGIVGVGGIGLELKFAYDNGEFDKVMTILIVIFATVVVLEQGAQWLRRRLIR